MSIRIGDIVELKRYYPYISINNPRGIITKIDYSNITNIYYVRIPPKYMKRSEKYSNFKNTLIVSRDEFRKIGKDED